MQTKRTATRDNAGEEIVNSVTHGVGIALAVAGFVFLVVPAAGSGSARHLTGVSIFGASLLFLYTASTLYHSIQHPRIKAILRLCDHSAIYVLIAGTYTPFTLVNLRGVWGWSLFGAIWGLAGIGIFLETLGRWRQLSIGLYVGMGWAAVVAVKPLFAGVAPGGLLLLLAGGLAYTSGLAFYAWRRLRYHHAVWHVFVLVGSAFHYLAVRYYVLPVSL